MPTGAITGHIDIAQLAVAVFFLFFAGLIFYLRREDKREGYPLEEPVGDGRLLGFPEPPPPKTYRLMDGGTATVPHHDSPSVLAARPLHTCPGSPLVPTGDRLRDSVGPGSYALRREQPLSYDYDKIQVLPLRELDDWSVAKGDADPRGMTVFGADGVAAGVVRDLWVDRSVKILRYLEVDLADPASEGPVLLPIYHTDISAKRRRVKVDALRAAVFVEAPRLRDPNRITAREEDQVNAFYAAARFWRGPILHRSKPA
jgi:photosynthetic reaction center H subunit